MGSFFPVQRDSAPAAGPWQTVAATPYYIEGVFLEVALSELRAAVTDALKLSMKAGDSARTLTLRMILARVKDADINARPRGIDRVPDEEVMQALRGMVKSRRESIALYEQGNRPELAAKEEAEIAVIEGFLPRQMDEAATIAAIEAAMGATGASTVKDMGRVMAALKAEHGAALDLGLANRLVKARLT